jgi:hypothetical protein
MDNFYSWMIKPVGREDVEVWFNMNNMIPEKRELFADFTFSLYNLIKDTYLGDEFDDNSETKVIMSKEEKQSHFEWCWGKTIENFNKENIKFNPKGEHKEYYENFFRDLFYFAEKKEIAVNIPVFFKELFNEYRTYTKSDLEMITDIYKRLDKNLNKKN